MKILNFSDIEKIMTEEQKKKANEMALMYYPEGTPTIDCSSNNPERDYLEFVDLECFS